MDAWHIWAIAGLVFIILEMLTTTFYLGSLGLACFVSAVAAFLGLGINGQLLVFALAAVAGMVFVRPLVRKLLFSDPAPQRLGAAGLIGQSAVVVDPVGDLSTPGRVKLGGEEWRAVTHEAPPIPAGRIVEITAVDSATLVVRPRTPQPQPSPQ